MRLFTSSLFILLILAFSVQASKLGEGRKQVGGTVAFSSSSGDLYENGDGDGQTTFGLNPFLTMFVGPPGLAVGAELDFSNTSQGDVSLSGWGIGPMVQYYIGAGEDKDMYPFVSAAFIYQSMTYDNGVSETDVTMTTIRLAGGILYFLNNNVGIHGQVSYDMDSQEVDVSGAKAVDGSVLGVEVGFSIFID